MADRLSVAAQTAWLTDPVFVTLAKSLYGDNVVLTDVVEDIIGKSDPDQSAVHVPGNSKKRKPMVTDPAQDPEDEKKAFGKALALAIEHEVITKREAVFAVEEFAKDWASYDAERKRHKDYKQSGPPKLANREARMQYHLDVINRAKRRAVAGAAGAVGGAATAAIGVAHGNIPLTVGGVIGGAASGGYANRQRQKASPHKGAITRMKNNDFHKDVVRDHWERTGAWDGFAHSDRDELMKRPEHVKAIVEAHRKKFPKEHAALRKKHLLNGVRNKYKVMMSKSYNEVSKLSGYDYTDKEHGYTWTDRVGYHADRGAIWQHNPTKGKTFYTAEKDGNDTPFEGEYKKFSPDRRPNVNRNINDPSPTVRGFAPKRDEDGKFSKAHEVTWEGEFSKVDDEKRQVFGWASVTEIDGQPVVDLQGDYIHPTEMERAAYDYVLKSRKGGDMHTRVDAHGNVIEKSDQPLHVSDMIESMVFTPEKVAKLGLPEGSLPTGWWVGFKVNDEPTWDLVKNGGRKGFSIHGMGARMEKRLEEIDPHAAIVGKAYAESADTNEFVANLETISEVTGDEFYKHLAHGMYVSQPTQYANTTRNSAIGAGLGATFGSHIGNVAAGVTGKDGAEARIIQGGTALAGGAIGAVAGHFAQTKHPAQHLVRPILVEQHLPRTKPVVAAKSYVEKAVSTANRKGNPSHMQGYYQQQALQEATAALAPQVANHLQNMQQQQWQQAQMEQQQMMMAAQQAGQPQGQQQGQPQAGQQEETPQGAQSQQQNWMTLDQQNMLNGHPMGPYGSQDNQNSSLTPSQNTSTSSASL